MTQLPNLDFEAVRIFTSLIETLNLSNTAETCGVSISSASRTIAKLRAVFKDELFHRYPHGMRPTQRAKELEAPMRRLLRGYEESITNTSASEASSDENGSRFFVSSFLKRVFWRRTTSPSFISATAFLAFSPTTSSSLAKTTS